MSKKWRLSSWRWKMNILISKLRNFSATGLFWRQQRARNSFRSLKTSYRLLSSKCILHHRCAKTEAHKADHSGSRHFLSSHFIWTGFIDVRVKGDESEKTENVFNYFFISSTLPETVKSLVWCRSHNRIISDIYYKTTRKCVHKLVINNLLRTVARITIVRFDLWRSLLLYEWKWAGARRQRECLTKPAQSCYC